MTRKTQYKKNKVIVVSPLGYTGLAYYDYSLCQSLSKQGLDVELCTSDRWILGTYKNTFRLLPVYRRCSGKNNIAIKGMNYFFSSLRILIYCLKDRVKSIHFQIVELPVIDLCLMVSLKLCGKHIVYTPHDIIHNKRYLLNNIITSAIYTVVDIVIVHKGSNKENLMEKYGVQPEKIRIIPHGSYEYFVEESVTKKNSRKLLGLKDDHKILLFFGNIRPGKGIEVLIKAIPLIRVKMSKLRLVIAGRLTGGITEQEILGSLDEEGVSEIVITKLEFIPEKEIIFYYMASDIVVLPYTHVSESGVLRYAQTCGKVIVCSDLIEFKDTVINGETGYIFRNKDYVDLANKVIFAFSDDQFEKIGANAKKIMEEKYTWNNIATLTKSAYEDTIES